MARTKKQAGRSISPVVFETVEQDVLSLKLDDQNPRLHPDERGVSQQKLIEIMLERFAIDEIAESICSSGFLPLDPFIGFRSADGMVILEGNRRLVTLKLLLEPKLCPERYAEKWSECRKRLPSWTVAQIRRIKVQVTRDRASANVLAYIGFRHVNGVLEWDAAEKAAYIAMLVDDHGWSYKQIADSIGSKRQYVEKWYVAHRLVEQAKADHVDGSEQMRRQFGVLDRALQSPKIRDFLGVAFPNDPRKSRRPSTKPNRDLEDFVRWSFGTDERKSVLEDSRDLTKWGTVLASPDAVRYMRTADDPRFDRAYAKSGGLKEGLLDSLQGAADRLEEAIPLIRQHVSDRDVQRAVERCADYFVQVLRYFPDVQGKQRITVRDDHAS